MIQHCRKTLHSRTKENRLVIQIQKALWRKVRPLFSRNKKLYASKEVKENALASEGKSCRPETKTTVNRYVCHDLSVWNKRLKSHLLSENVEPSRAWSTQQRKQLMGTSSILAWSKSHVGLPINTPRCNSCWRLKCSWSLSTCLWNFTFWKSHDSICTFRISSSLIAGACKIRNWTSKTNGLSRTS